MRLKSRYWLFLLIILTGYASSSTAASRTASTTASTTASRTASKQLLFIGGSSGNTTNSVITTEQAPVRFKMVAKKKKRVKKKRRWCDRRASAGYKRMKQRWQKPLKHPEIKWRDGYRNLAMYSVNTGVHIDVFPFLADGSLDPEALKEVSRVLADKDSGAQHEVAPRLVKLLYKVSNRFDANRINVISGYREPADSKGTESHHSNGSAVDFMIPGVKLPITAKVIRRFGHVGVGYYPVSGFVHMDVREGPSYFWSDASGPGKRSCMRQIMSTAGWKFDSKYKPEDDQPEPERDKKGRLRGATEEDENSKEHEAADQGEAGKGKGYDPNQIYCFVSSATVKIS